MKNIKLDVVLTILSISIFIYLCGYVLALQEENRLVRNLGACEVTGIFKSSTPVMDENYLVRPNDYLIELSY